MFTQRQKKKFSTFASNHGENAGVMLAHAILEYYAENESDAEGRLGRIESKLKPVLDDVKPLVEMTNDESNGGLRKNSQEYKAIQVCNRFSYQIENDGGFSRDKLHDTIRDVAGQSDKTINDIEELVLEKIDYAPNPNNGTALYPIERCREIADSMGIPGPDAPAIDQVWKGYSDLSRDEKIEGIMVVLGRETVRNDRHKREFRAEKINELVFDNRATESHVLSLMHEVADKNTAYEFKERRKTTSLIFDNNDLYDEQIQDAIYPDEDDDEADELEEEAAAEMEPAREL